MKPEEERFLRRTAEALRAQSKKVFDQENTPISVNSASLR